MGRRHPRGLRRSRCAAAVTLPPAEIANPPCFQTHFLGLHAKGARAAVTLREPCPIILCTQSRLYQLFTACSAKAGSSSISSFVPSAKTAVPSNRPNIWWQQLFTTTARIRVVRSAGSASNPACPSSSYQMPRFHISGAQIKVHPPQLCHFSAVEQHVLGGFEVSPKPQPKLKPNSCPATGRCHWPSTTHCDRATPAAQSSRPKCVFAECVPRPL